MENKALSLLSIDQALERYIQRHPQIHTTPIYVGLSAGLDSSVLLHALAHRFEPKQLTAIHINHGLQVDAAAFEQQAIKLCHRLDIKIITRKVLINQGASLELQARNARFNAFSDIVPKQAHVFLAHHGDDQIETFFMRLLRGAGLKGLASMQGHQPFAHFYLARPFLSLTKSQLERYAQTHQIEWVEDTSNQDTHFKRNHIRHNVLPHILNNNEQSGHPYSDLISSNQRSNQDTHFKNIIRSIEQLNEDYQTLELLLQPYVEACIKPVCYPYTAGFSLNLETLMHYQEPIQALLLRHWLAKIGRYAPNKTQIAEIQSSIVQAKVGAQPKYVYQNGHIVRHQNALYWIQQATTPKECDVTLGQGASCRIEWAETNLRVHKVGKIKAGQYTLKPAFAVRTPVIKSPKRATKSFNQLFQEARIPPWLRANWPVLLDSDEVVAVLDLAIAQSVYCENGWSVSYIK